MSVSRQSFLAAHWDWLVTLLGVLALVAAGALFALKMGDTESADAYAQSLNAMRPAHEGVAPVDLDVLRKALRGAEKPPQLAAVDPRKANFLASERRVLCRQGDSSSKKKACGKPIPADCEVCPFCGAHQAIVKVEVGYIQQATRLLFIINISPTIMHIIRNSCHHVPKRKTLKLFSILPIGPNLPKPSTPTNISPKPSNSLV